MNPYDHITKEMVDKAGHHFMELHRQWREQRIDDMVEEMSGDWVEIGNIIIENDAAGQALINVLRHWGKLASGRKAGVDYSAMFDLLDRLQIALDKQLEQRAAALVDRS